MSNMIERNIFVLRDASSVAQPIEYVQGTNAVPILLHVRDYEIPAGSTARVYVEWPSTKGEYDAGGVTINVNDILIKPKDTLFSEVGKSKLQVCIVNGEKTLVTFSYPVMVKRNHVPGITTPSANHSDFLDEYIANMQSATNSANEAAEEATQSANEANEALEAFKSALEGTVINDETPSDVTTYSSKKIEMFDIQTSTDTTLHNTKQGGYRLNELVGKTEQKTYAGNQLFDASKLSSYNNGGATVTNNGDGSFTVSGSGNLTAGIGGTYTYTHEETVKMLKAGTLKFDSAVSSPAVYVYILRNNSIVRTVSYFQKTAEITQDILDDPTTVMRLSVYGGSGDTIKPATVKPMLYQDGDGTWEPFVGHTPSPNPSFPQALENTFEYVEMIQGVYSYSNGAYSTSNSTVCCKRPIPCKGGDVVKITVDSDTSYGGIVWFKDGEFLSVSYPNTTDWQSTAPSGVTEFVFNIGDSISGGTNLNKVGKITLTANGKYVGQIVEHGKNFFNALGSFDKFTSIGSGYRAMKIFVGVDSTVTVSVAKKYSAGEKVGYIGVNSSGAMSTAQGVINWLYSNSNASLCNESVTVVSTDGYVSVVMTSDAYNNFKDELQVELSDKKTEYEPYTEKVATIFLDEPLREGDRLVKVDGVHMENHKRASVKIPQLDTWFSSGSSVDRYYTSLSALGITNYGDSASFMCTHFTRSNDGEQVGAFVLSSGNIGFALGKKGTTTVDDFKELVANEDIYLEYDLAEETYTPLDTASQLALNEMVTFDGVTYIEVDSKVKPTSISGEYGTSLVSARVLKEELRNDTDQVEREDMETQIETLRNMILSLGGNV